MTRDPDERQPGQNGRRRRRLRADEVRRARQTRGPRQARVAPISGRRVEAPQYQPRLSDQYPAVEEAPAKKRGWTPLRMGLLATGLTAFVLAAIFVVPVLIQMYQTADQVFQEPDDRLKIVETDDGIVAVPENEATDENAGNDGDQSTNPEEVDLPDWDADERINIMLLGSDSRERGDEDSFGGRSDTIIIVTIDPKTNKVGMLSIPRDLQVEIPDLGMDKINAAYSYGGRELTRAVVEYHFDITIHYYAEVDFVGFVNIVNTIGGVVIDNPAVIKDDNYEWTRAYFPTGPQHMNGEEALRYARTRYDDNDFARGQRQQRVLKALRSQGVRLGLITRARDLLQDVGDSFRTDLSIRETLALAQMANNVKNEDIQSYSIVECTSEDYVPDVYYYLVPDWDCIQGIMNEMIPPGGQQGDEAIAPDYDADVLVENATFVNRLAGRTSDQLAGEGYTNVDVAQADNAGNQPRSVVNVYGANESTARDIANIIGIDSDQVIMQNGSHPSGYEIVVVLGDDAPQAAGN